MSSEDTIDDRLATYDQLAASLLNGMRRIGDARMVVNTLQITIYRHLLGTLPLEIRRELPLDGLCKDEVLRAF